MRTITITDFLTEDQIERCVELERAKEICKEVISPNIQVINEKLGQENDPMYLAYCCEYVVSVSKRKEANGEKGGL